MRKPIPGPKRLRRDWRYGGRILAAIAAAALGGCSAGVLDPKGPVASAEKLILFDSLGIMLAIVIPTIVATLGVAVWFRASNTRASYWPEWEYSGRLEMIVWSIPAMTVMLLGSLCWVGSHELDPGKPLVSAVKPLNIQVVSLDWKWLFIYPEQGIASVNALTIPAATPISLQLTSSGVMNSFFVPQLGSQIYTMGQMMTRLQLQADNPGTYEGRSFNFSGDGFSDMYFFVRAVPPDQFTAWAAQTKGAGTALDPQSYAELEKPSQAVPPFTYGSVSPGLFATLVSGEMPQMTRSRSHQHN
jgi:cytochrome o ubiquinol oxidase subunit II